MGSIKQYIFLRSDLRGYTTGALVAQGSHASIAAIEKYRSHPQTESYVRDLVNMTTVVYQMVGSDVEMVKKSLDSLEIEYYEWIEDGNITTCISTRPADLSDDREFSKMKKAFKLFRQAC